MSNVATIPQTVTPAPAHSFNALVPTTIEQALTLADVMAKASLIPEHLRNKPGDCLLVVMQAQRWGMDAVSVAQCTSVVRGKLCYEGKLVAAMLYSLSAIDGRLRYEFSGSGEHRAIKVIGRPRGSATDQTVEGTVGDWKTENGNWKKSPDDMLVYRGTRQWARRYAPEALLGVYTPDEFEDEPVAQARVVSQVQAPAALPPYADADIEKNKAMWSGLIESGKRSPDQIIAMVETKFVLTAEQKSAIRKLDSKTAPEPLDGEEAQP